MEGKTELVKGGKCVFCVFWLYAKEELCGELNPRRKGGKEKGDGGHEEESEFR